MEMQHDPAQLPITNKGERKTRFALCPSQRDQLQKDYQHYQKEQSFQFMGQNVGWNLEQFAYEAVLVKNSNAILIRHAPRFGLGIGIRFSPF